MVLGRGGFGKVWVVSRKNSKKHFALKEMNKALVLSKNSAHSVLNERLILAKLNDPFIVNMKGAF